MRLGLLQATIVRAGAVSLGLLALGWACPFPSAAHGGFHEQLERANHAVAADPSAPERYLARAELYRHHGDHSDALADLDRAAALDPSRHEVDYFRGRVHLDSGRAQAAEAALRRYLEREPGSAAARAARAQALVLLGRSLEAAREYTRAITVQPVPIPAYYLKRASALAAAGGEHLPEAIRGLDEGLAALGPAVTLQRAAIELEIRRENYDQALARLDRAAAGSPRQETWLARRGEILERAGHVVEARDSFELALGEIERLPPHRRRTDAMVRLEARLRGAIRRFSEIP